MSKMVGPVEKGDLELAEIRLDFFAAKCLSRSVIVLPVRSLFAEGICNAGVLTAPLLEQFQVKGGDLGQLS